MDRTTPLQHLLRNLLPSRGRPVAPAPGFMDTCPEGAHATSSDGRHVEAAPRPPGGWSESALDLVLGTEIMEYPEDTAADLMDEFFASSKKRAA